MQNFIYHTPTKVVFGKDAEKHCGKLVKEYGGHTVLLHYGGDSAIKSGLIARVESSLQAEGIKVIKLGGVKPNPLLSLVHEGIKLCRSENVDFILPVGGGSVIDSGKAIAYGLADAGGGDVWDFFAGARKPTAFTPLGCVPTLAAAGSEMSNSTVITNEEWASKRGYNDDIARPLFAVMNPALTLTVPAYHTAAGCADILMHTLERYFTSEANTLSITDAIAEALMRDVIKNTLILVDDPQNFDARAAIMWAGALSHNGLTNCGGGPGDWACHRLGHELSAKYNLAHGASLTTIWGAWAKYVYGNNPSRFLQLGINVLGLDNLSDKTEAVPAVIEKTQRFFKQIGMPTNFADAGIAATDEDMEKMASGCSRGGTRTIGAIKVLSEDDMGKIYRIAAQQ